MFKYLPELVSSYFIAREMGSAGKGAQFWESAYHAKTNEMLNSQAQLKAEQDLVIRMREEAIVGHNNVLELVKQLQEAEKENFTLYRGYTQLVEQIEDLGFEVDDENMIIVPEDVEVTEEEVDERSPLDKDPD